MYRTERLSWVEIDRGALIANLREFRRRVGKTRICFVVKAEAYGHGMLPVAKIAQKHGADQFAVATLDEAMRLLEGGIRKPILILGYVTLGRLADAVERGFRLTVFNLQTLERLAEICRRRRRRVRIHIKLETGTNRHGIDEHELPAFLQILERNPRLRVEGASMHFANIEDTTDHSYARMQINRFEHLLQKIEAAGYRPAIRHAACTAAAILFNRTHFDMIRLGIGGYGYWPSRETHVSVRERRARLTLRPALTWKTLVAQVKEIPAGSSVGYGGTYMTTRPVRIAVLPVGYSDGYDRRLSNSAHVLIHGKRAPVRGRVCMNVMMVDVTDIPGVKLEDEVVLLGRQGDEAITAEQLATLAGTINYEIVSRIHPDIPRVVLGGARRP